MDDLKSKKWDLINGKTRFHPEIMRDDAKLHLPVFHATYGEGRFGDRAVRMCVRCEALSPLENCPNCGNEGFSPGYDADGVAGLFCKQCDRGFVEWSCPSCGTVNPISKSLATEKKGCFVATAVCGREDAPEVLALQAFRDRRLATTALGRLLVRGYYRWSPAVAVVLEDRAWLRRVVRLLAIRPLASMARAAARDRSRG